MNSQHPRTRTKGNAEWSETLRMLLVPVALFGAVVLVSEPLLAVGVGLGLFARPAARAGRRAGRRLATALRRLLDRPTVAAVRRQLAWTR